MKIAFIGAGKVGSALAGHLAEAHEVVLAESRQGSSSIASALGRVPRLTAAPIESAVAAAEVVFLTTPFPVTEGLIRPLAGQLASKVVVDCTSPVGPGLTHALKSERSGSELLQTLIPQARLVKAFSIYGAENLADPAYPAYSTRPAMMFCGDDASAKEIVSRLISDVGFEPVDVGGLVQALHLEHMTLLWVRLVRANRQSPNLVWAAMRR